MKIVKNIILLGALFALSNNSIGQATTLGNTGVNSDYLGWNNLTNINLEIRNDNPNDIEFIVPGNIMNTSIIEDGLEVGYSVNTYGTSEVSIGFMSLNDNIGLRAGNDFLVAPLGIPPATGGVFLSRATALTSIGVYGECLSVNNPNQNIGIDAFVCTTEGTGYAVYGEAFPGAQTTLSSAGYFNGDVYRDAAWTVSDENLKENISLFTEATELLMQLNPVSYEFKVDEYSHLSLPGGTHYGFLTQEVKTIIPEITKTVITPTNYDNVGNVENPSMEIEALNYTGLIPLIVGSLNERQELIDQQTAAIMELEASIILLEAQLEE